MPEVPGAVLADRFRYLLTTPLWFVFCACLVVAWWCVGTCRANCLCSVVCGLVAKTLTGRPVLWVSLGRTFHSSLSYVCLGLAHVPYLHGHTPYAPM